MVDVRKESHTRFTLKKEENEIFGEYYVMNESDWEEYTMRELLFNILVSLKKIESKLGA